ncbi:phosphotransferase [Roseobacter weihaiensis]|uniref:phosphotransferase n=1 Tax=Roseobacter weihaiensis TaxID=2763262 RepID=UPI001D0A89D9|nr:phosphotransferase [Roseobacter sp. H9]
MPRPAAISPQSAHDVVGGGRADLLSHEAPAISPDLAAELARDLYGIAGQVHKLTAEKDANFRVTDAVGAQALLKITNAAEDPAVTDMQTAALLHLAAVDPTLPVPHVRPSLNGRASERVTLPTGQTHVVRLLSYLDGTVLSGAANGAALHHDIGRLLGRLTLALRGFSHPAAGHLLQWDIQQAHRLRPMLEAVAGPRLRARLTDLIDLFEADIQPRLVPLRAQVGHNDFNPHNLLVDGPEATRLTGIIDFGDMVRTPVVCDLAVACSYQITDGDRPLDDVARLIAGYTEVLPLQAEEVALLPDLMRLRHATSLTIGAWRARRYPENAEYILRNGAASLRGLNALDRICTDAAVAALSRRENAR